MQNAVVTYVGDLAVDKYLSIVDSALNSNNPCVDAATAGAGADSAGGEVLLSNAYGVQKRKQVSSKAFSRLSKGGMLVSLEQVMAPPAPRARSRWDAEVLRRARSAEVDALLQEEARH